MSRSVVRAVLLVLALVLALPLSAAGPGTATLAPLGLPTAKASVQEFKYSFGKDWENALRAEVKADLAAAKIFSDIVPEGGDLLFTLNLEQTKRTWDDRIKLSGKGTLDFRGSGTFSWKRGETVVSEGRFEVKHVVTIDRQPWRADLATGWRDVMRQAVQESIDKGNMAGTFGTP